MCVWNNYLIFLRENGLYYSSASSAASAASYTIENVEKSLKIIMKLNTSCFTKKKHPEWTSSIPWKILFQQYCRAVNISKLATQIVEKPVEGGSLLSSSDRYVAYSLDNPNLHQKPIPPCLCVQHISIHLYTSVGLFFFHIPHVLVPNIPKLNEREQNNSLPETLPFANSSAVRTAYASVFFIARLSKSGW